MSSLFAPLIVTDKNGDSTLELQVQGLKCAGCAARVREALGAEGGPVDLASGHVQLSWRGDGAHAEEIIAKIEKAGYSVAPFEPDAQSGASETALLWRCMLASGAASLVVMGGGMMGLLPFWLLGLVTVLTVAYAGRPFFASALRALRGGHVNMDVPISLAVLLTTALGLVELAASGAHAYFDSALMLLFILLIGRLLEARMRSRARSAAAGLLSLFSGKAVILENEATREIPVRSLRPDMILNVAMGEKIAADGVVTQGLSEADASLITGETLPVRLDIGSRVFGGMINLGAPLHVRVTLAPADSLVSEVIKLMEQARQSHARFVRLADRVAAIYTPVVFLLAALAFFGWLFAAGASWQTALGIACTVLIITCPCAMGLAVPAVQVIAGGRLFKRGILLKSGDALEKLAQADTIVFDKTGTLTLGRFQLQNRADFTASQLKLAASLASQSRHPLARAVLEAFGEGPVLALEVEELAGLGLQTTCEGKRVRLGRREWCGDSQASESENPELWLWVEGSAPVCLAFADTLRPDAPDVIEALRRAGYALYLYSGDRQSVVAALARTLGISSFQAHMTPADKHAALAALKQEGRRVLMVGDGLNDAAALAMADVSMSPSSALDLTQNAADLVFQGEKLSPVLEALGVARSAEKRVRENIALAVGYNIIAVPLALLGLVTPVIAAAAMSLSSLTVTLNAAGLRRGDSLGGALAGKEPRLKNKTTATL